MKSIIKDISKKSSAGLDEIPYSMLSHVSHNIYKQLTFLVNLSFQEGIFPQILNTALVVPIHKKGDKSKFDNYRGLSLLSVFSKIYEKAFHTRLLSYINKHNIIEKSQFGFREGISVQDALLALCNHILSNFDKGNKVICLFFDLARAFETVNHPILLEKLYHSGVRGTALKWIHTFLSKRFQKVKVNVNANIIFSSEESVLSGVPQGSIIGPLLFLIFVNDLNQLINDSSTCLVRNPLDNFSDAISVRVENVEQQSGCYVTQFADDTTVALNSNNFFHVVQKANCLVKSMTHYCLNNALILNGSKTNMVTFSPSTMQMSPLVKLDNGSVVNSHSTKLLGVYLDSNLSWSSHVDYVVGRLSVHCYVLWQLRNFVSLDILKLYYFAHVQSILQYCLVCWGNCSRINEVLVLQKKIIRTMTFRRRLDSCRPVFKQLNILTVISLYIFSCVVYVKSHRWNFICRNDVSLMSGYNFRYRNDLVTPVRHLTVVGKGPYPTCVRLYNKLPNYVKESNIYVFKRTVKDLLLVNTFYSLEEYLQASF